MAIQNQKGHGIYIGLQIYYDLTVILLKIILACIKGNCSMSEAEDSYSALFSFGETYISTASCFECLTLKYRQFKETPERFKIINED